MRNLKLSPFLKDIVLTTITSIAVIISVMAGVSVSLKIVIVAFILAFFSAMLFKGENPVLRLNAFKGLFAKG